MSLIPWTPLLDTFSNLEQEIGSFAPAVNIYENQNNVIVEATLAGIKPEDVEISVHEDVLTIEGSRKSTSEVEEKNYYRKEVRSGSFHRVIALPISVQANKAKADFQNGLLKIILPKETKTKSKNIKIDIKKK